VADEEKEKKIEELKAGVLFVKKEGDTDLLRKERAFTETIASLERKNKALVNSTCVRVLRSFVRSFVH
jgi:hypothetical protein